MKELIFVTSNEHKVQELKQILSHEAAFSINPYNLDRNKI